MRLSVRMAIAGLALLAGASAVRAQTVAGPNNAGSVANNNLVGTNMWSNPNLAQGPSDGASASANAASGNPTYYLEATNFGFALPADTVIGGIRVDIKKDAAGGVAFDNGVFLVRGSMSSVIVGTDHSLGGAWPAVSSVVSYGGPGDLWGTTWTVADINNANFGVVISAHDSMSGALAQVDSFAITIFGLCPPSPLAGCRTSAKGILTLKKSTPAKDKLVWKWTRGQATTFADFGVPTGTTAYALCIYDNGTQKIAASIDPSATKWKVLGTNSGYKYKDSSGASDGITKALLKAGAGGKAKAQVKGKGVKLPTTTLPLTTPVRAQLVNSANPICYEPTLTVVKKNTSTLFKVKSP
jgi:hypothetical protein